MKKRISVTTSLLMLSLIMLTGCSTTQVVIDNSTPATQAAELIPYDELLDIGILPVDSNIPEDLAQIEKKYYRA